MGYSPWGCRELDTTEWLTLSLWFYDLFALLPFFLPSLPSFILSFVFGKLGFKIPYTCVRKFRAETSNQKKLKKMLIFQDPFKVTVASQSASSMTTLKHTLPHAAATWTNWHSQTWAVVVLWDCDAKVGDRAHLPSNMRNRLFSRSCCFFHEAFTDSPRCNDCAPFAIPTFALYPVQYLGLPSVSLTSLNSKCTL